MNYMNGRAAKLNDRVLAQSSGGPYIGTVVAFEGDKLRVMPMYAQSAHYIEPAETLHLDDALASAKPASGK